MADDAEQVL